MARRSSRLSSTGVLMGLSSSKDAALLRAYLPQLSEIMPGNLIVYCTITGFGGTVLEPGIKPAEEQLKAYHRWVKDLGPENVVLRIDPIIPTEKGVARAVDVAKHAESRVRVSFIDQYPHVIERFNRLGAKLPWNTFHAPTQMRLDAYDDVNSVVGIQVEICGEPGFYCTGCVSYRDFDAMGLYEPCGKLGGQRSMCQCLVEKTEILAFRGQCRHKCAYCYWK